jgi:uroporphyrinogen-III synthase
LSFALPACLLLTRPLESARTDAEAARALGWRGGIVIAPLMQITLRPLAQDDLAGVQTIIATSQHAIAALVAGGAARNTTLWCVGPRTLAAAQQAGFTDLRGGTGADGAELLAQMLAAGITGPALHLHGDHLALDLAARLRAAGHQARGLAVYGQDAIALSGAGQACLNAAGDVVVPLYSPRSAQLFANVWASLAQPKARLHLIALSENVAKVVAHLPAGSRQTLTFPDGEEMLHAQIRVQAALEAAENPR